MLQEARQRHERAVAAANETLAQHRERLAEMRSRRDEARAGRQWWAWLRGVQRVSRELQNIPSALPVAAEVLQRQETLRAEVAGEQQAEAALGRIFGDGWILLRGYRNQAGEIGQLILGRRGLIAVGVEHLNATVHNDGDDWRADQYDQDGNLVAQHPIADPGGRSPGRQLSEPADRLEQLLSSRGHRVPVQRVVLLTHPRSKVGRRRDSAVHITTSAQDIGQLARESAVALDLAQVDAIEQLIVSDHHQAP
jgi:Nuclease-related domain